MVKNNVYVGQRYVPKIMGEWNQLESYEGLSIVTNEGTSYTSKKRVPTGIEISNEEYWVVTGNYNAQIELYRADVKQQKENLEETNRQLSETKQYINNQPIQINQVIEQSKEINDKIVLAEQLGKTVFIPKLDEPYVLDGSIMLKSGVNISSNGATLLLKDSVNQTMMVSNGNDIIVDGLILDGNHLNNTGDFSNGIHITDGDNIEIKNCVIRNVNGRDTNDGLIKVSKGSNIRILNNVLYGGKTAGIVTIGELSNYINVENNDIHDIEYSGIMIKTKSNNCLIKGNKVVNCKESNISVNGSNNIVDGNIVKTSGIQGINIGHLGNDGNEHADNCRIVNNLLYDVAIGGNSLSNCLISGNFIENSIGRALSFGMAKSLIISNNHVIGGSDLGGLNIINSDQTQSMNHIIDGNIFENIGREGIRLSGCSDSKIINNLVKNPVFLGSEVSDQMNSAIILEPVGTASCENNIIMGNIIKDERTDFKVKRGIWTVTVTSKNNLIQNNVINGLETAIQQVGNYGTNLIDNALVAL